MGIFINMEISKSVTKKEWEEVYKETLLLVDKLPFAEEIRKSIHDISIICLARSQERSESWGWNNEKVQTGWFTNGDYDTMNTAETYFMPRELVDEAAVEPDAGDAILGNISSYLDYDWKSDICKHTYKLWGAKTQGERYHLYLLAVACLIEARLRNKAFTHGDITRGQCKKAVEIANQYLETPIEMPGRCYMDRLFERVSQMLLSEDERLVLFESLYLGTKDKAYGEFIRKVFSEKRIDAYWHKIFSEYTVNMLGFGNRFHEYMTQGFDLETLCGYVRLTDEDGEDRHKEFLKRIMDAKMHIKDKNCVDQISIDKEAEAPYGIWTLLAQFSFAGARNRKIDRYIPIEEIRKALRAGLKQYDDVDQIIDDYLEEENKQMDIVLAEAEKSEELFAQAVEQDKAEVFNQIVDKKREESEKYDVSDYGRLKFFKNGDTMHPRLQKSLGKSRIFLDSILKEEQYKELQGKAAADKCKWLAGHNTYLLIRDKDWEKIFSEIEQNEESFGRYYPIMRVELNNDDLVDISVGLMINDDLYAYSKILAEQME